MRLGWSIAALALLAVSLVVTMPASLLDGLLRQRLDDRLRLASAQGTVWEGRGWLELRERNGRAGIGKEIAWRMDPSQLLVGRLRYAVEFDRSATWHVLDLTNSTLSSRRLEMQVPARVLSLLAPAWVPVELFGAVSVQLSDFSLNRERIEGDITLVWRNAGSPQAPLGPLGDYELRIGARGTSADATLRTLKGPLQLDGEGAWRINQRPEFRTVASVPAELRPQLGPFLKLLGKARTDGSVEMVFH